MIHRLRNKILALVCCGLAGAPLASFAVNSPPLAPTITEPSPEGRIVDPADVHMETGPFSDPDPGDTHVCSDFEIWLVSPIERVWVTSCIGGIEKLHTHLGDGVFENSHAGRHALFFDTNYRFRVRHRDSSGDPATEWSAWSERGFRTSVLIQPQPGATGWTVKQPGYKVEIVATNFQLPVNIAFVPNPGDHPDDPFYYVTELYGAIKVVTRDGTVSNYATNLLNFNPTGLFPGTGEQGLAGIVVDTNSDIFVGVLYEDTNSTANPKPHYPKVMRFHSNDGGFTAATQTTILDMFGETQGQSHQISNLSFGPDNKLYVHMGDGFDATRGVNTNTFRGKVLRMNRDGSAVTNNPFYNAGNGITATDYIFAYGLRNPFGGAWRASDGFHYDVENGPSVDRFAKIVAARNYLYDGSDASMTNRALYNWSPASGPVNIAFIQPQTFGGSGFPTNKYDHAFVTESGATYASGPAASGKRITEFVLDANGNLVSGPTKLVEYNGTGYSTAVALAAGPDGLYFSDLYKDANVTSPTNRGANILRVRFIGLPPTGNGDGLKGEYYDNTNFTSLKLTRTNATVDFDWGTGSPDASIAADTFSVRWTGLVQPQFSETYTFYTTTDDGARLWVDGQLLIDKWVDQSATNDWTGNLALTAFRKYSVMMEYFENGGGASTKLSWSSPSTPKAIIPQTQLYSGPTASLPFRFQSTERPTNNQFRVNLSGVPGDIHRVEASTDLINWTLSAMLTNVNGSLLFLDLLATNFAERFYRMKAGGPYPADIVVDNASATTITNSAAWTTGTISTDRYSADYRYKNTGTGANYVQFTPVIPAAGNYQVYEWHPQGSNRTTVAMHIIQFNGGTQTNLVNQQTGGGQWNLLGTFGFSAGTAGNLRITDNFSGTGVVIADAIKLVYVP
jgi:glucose/arabinose dehydrogenase